MEYIGFASVLLVCIWQCSGQTSSTVESTSYADVTSNSKETLITLTSNTKALEPSATLSESSSQSSVNLQNKSTNTPLPSDHNEDWSTTNFITPFSTLNTTAYVTSSGEQTHSGSQPDSPTKTIEGGDGMEPTLTTGSSLSRDSTPTPMPSISSVIDGSSHFTENISSSLHEDKSIPTSTVTLNPESTLTETPSLYATPEISATDYSSMVREDLSSSRSDHNIEAGADYSQQPALVLSSSQSLSSDDVSSQLVESSYLFSDQDEVMCNDQTCLHSMQSTSTVVSSSEHDISFNSLTTLQTSSTNNLEISSAHFSDMISPSSPTQHENLQSSSMIMPSSNLLENSSVENEESTPLNFSQESDSVTTTYISTAEDCCSALFTDSTSVITVSSTENSPASSTIDNTFTTLVSPNTIVAQTTQSDGSSSIGSSTTSATTTAESSNSTEVTSLTPPVMDQNTTTDVTTTQSTTTTTTQTTTMTQQVSTNSSSTTVTTAISTTEAINISTDSVASTLTTESDIAVTTEKTLNISDAWSEYWVVTVLIVPTDEDTESFKFRNEMETDLANLYDEGYKRAESAQSNRPRTKRAVTKNNVTIQITNVTRDTSNAQVTNIIYYMETHGNLTEAQVVVDLMSYFRIQEVALLLGREVVVQAKVYTVPEPPPEEPDRKLWIIGVVFGSIIFFIGICWFTLFVYFKCTRPSPRKLSHRTPRSFRSEVYTNEGGSLTKTGFKPNEVKGFDVVRTEVGLENEIYQNDRRSTEVKEPYRRRDGSTELEGMYSGGDGSPDRKIVPSVSPPLKNKRLKQISMESENDTEERQTDMSEDRLPLSPPKLRKPKKGKKKHNRSHRGKGKKHSDGKDAPKPKIRSSIHPAPRSSYGNDDDEDDEEEIQSPVLVIPAGTMPEDMDDVRRSLKAKTEIERQNNKRRQRSLKSEDLVKDTNDPVEMKRLQRELDSILDPSSAHSSLGSRSHENDDEPKGEPKDPKHVPLYLENFVLKKRPDSNLWNAYNASDEAANISKQTQSIPPERLKTISQISFDSDDNDSVGSGRRGRVRSAEYPSPRPANMLFGAHRQSKGKKPFNLPKDEYTSIRMSTSIIAPESKRNKRDSEQSDSGRYSSDDNHESINGQGSSLQEAYLITEGRTTSLKDGYLVQHVSPTPKLIKSSSVDNPRPSVHNNSAIKCTIAKPSERINSSDDEVDAAEMVMKEPAGPIMVTSIRQELQRHVQKSPRPNTSITKF